MLYVFFAPGEIRFKYLGHITPPGQRSRDNRPRTLTKEKKKETRVQNCLKEKKSEKSKYNPCRAVWFSFYVIIFFTSFDCYKKIPTLRTPCSVVIVFCSCYVSFSHQGANKCTIFSYAKTFSWQQFQNIDRRKGRQCGTHIVSKVKALTDA